MSVIRAFIAINLSQEILRKLDQLITELKEIFAGVPLQWVAAHNIHLTIKFLGDVQVQNLESIKSLLKVEASRYPQFEIHITKLGVFPSISRPRVVWVGVEAPTGLFSLQKGIEEGIARLGYPPEERKFSAHLTLARLSKRATPDDSRYLGEILGNVNVVSLGVTPVQEIHLYQSELNPRGSIYTMLFSAPLKQQNQSSK
jgi:2'-5' RNA ligase